ncbi:MAG: phage integrase N-terminal SAM-like domain-containing protein [Deinococcota bacterium]
MYFYDERHPKIMGETEVRLYLSYLAVEKKVPAK